MKVSVLVPVYGVEKFIAQCATNLMDQTYKDVEYIFVNDCTPDASIEQLKQVIVGKPCVNHRFEPVITTLLYFRVGFVYIIQFYAKFLVEPCNNIFFIKLQGRADVLYLAVMLQLS